MQFKMMVTNVEGKVVTLESDPREDEINDEAHCTMTWKYADDVESIMDKVGDIVTVRIR